MTALWEALDRVCGKQLNVMIPILLPALEQHGRLKPGLADRDRVFAITPATIDRLLVDVRVAASGGRRRRRAGFYSTIRRKVPIGTINDCPQPNYAKRRSGESGLAMGLASITSPQSESRFAASESLPIPSGRKML